MSNANIVSTPASINFTISAADKVASLIQEENNPKLNFI